MKMLDDADVARTIEQRLSLHLAWRVYFTRALFAPDNPLFAEVTGGDRAPRSRPLLVVVDAGVARHHPLLVEQLEAYCRERCPHLALVEAPRVVCGGERVKNDPAQVTLIHEAIAHHNVDAHGFVCAIGGGALLDMAGYAASTAQRGVRLLRVPTTVLAQHHVGVGITNGVNAYGRKNFLGTRAAPFAVLNDLELLTTLEDRDWRAGLAEAIRVALLGDAAFFDALERDADALRARDLAVMARIVHRSAELHLERLCSGGDPLPADPARPLDFGRVVAHRLGTLTEEVLRHGEAVAIGIGLDATLAQLEGLLSEDAWLRILRLFDALGLPCYDPVVEAHLGAPPDDLPDKPVVLVTDAGGAPVHAIETRAPRPERVLLAAQRLRIAAAAVTSPHAPQPTDAPWPPPVTGAPPASPAL